MNEMTSGTKTETDPTLPVSVKVLSQGYDGITQSAVNLSGGLWERYGTSGGSLVLGGAVAIIALVATTIKIAGWTGTDLIAGLSFSAVLIVLGTIAGHAWDRVQERKFELEVTAYKYYKDGLAEMARALEEGRPKAPEGSDGKKSIIGH
jgi:hypothetical protein